MGFETHELKAVIRAASKEAKALGSPDIEAEHLLLALAGEDGSPIARVLADSGLDRDGLIAALERETERSLAAVGVGLGDFALPPAPTPRRRAPGFAASARKAVERAALVSRLREARGITAPHLLLGILATDIGTVPRALVAAEVDKAALVAGAERLAA